jgi:deazaflavin-dependent oxidoreductase (nitroreductase family)
MKVPRTAARTFWKIANPVAAPLAGFAPWWVLLETSGRRSGKRRRTPFAHGPSDGNVTYIIATHGERSGFAHNIAADPRVRLKRLGRWRAGTASFMDLDDAIVRRFNRYGRLAISVTGDNPKLLRIEFDPTR